MNLLRNTALATAVAAMTLANATPAAARDHYRYYRHRNNDAAIAITAGVIGLAIGAAIASDRPHRYYYDDGYYYRERYDYPRYPRYYYYETYPRDYNWRWHHRNGRHWHHDDDDDDDD